MTSRIAAVVLVLCVARQGLALTLDFEELPLADGATHYNGSDMAGAFVSHDIEFVNSYEVFSPTCCWEGFAYSTADVDLKVELNSQYVAQPGAGAGMSQLYGIAFSGYDAGNGGLIPKITLPAGATPVSIAITNVRYTVDVLKRGNSFSKQFGGPSGDDPDWLRMRVEAYDAAGSLLGQVESYLADYRFADNSQDYVLDTWRTLDLASLAQPGVHELHFRIDGSDVDLMLGLNSPAYVAIDDLVLDVGIAGDYNADGLVNLADYTVWRDTLGSEAVPAGSGADGDSSGVIDGGDYSEWKSHFGAPSSAAGIARGSTVPEPAGLLALLLSVGIFGGSRYAILPWFLPGRRY